MKTAFSYIRFSSPEQARGDSFRRQSEQAEDWAKANGYRIAKTWKDLGVSSYRGANVKSGQFAEFLRDVAADELPEHSVLILENLDRMSRQDPEDALMVFLGIIKKGVGILTLSDQKLYTKQRLKQDRTMLFVTLMAMTRANEESALKGKRVAAAWARKRLAAREKSLPLTDRIPGWLTSTRDATGRRVFTADPKKADAVRRIFVETEQGLGRRAIVKNLNRGDVPSFLSKSGWQPSSVIKIIRSRTTVGEYQPHRRDEDGKRIPDGEPIMGYYPIVVDEDLWVRANGAVAVRRTNAGGRPGVEAANLLRGLAHCACGKRMLFLNKGAPPKGGRYYVCSAAVREDKCDNKRLWNAKEVERHLLHQIDPKRVSEAFEPSEKRTGPSPLQRCDTQLAELTARKKRTFDLLVDNEDSVMAPELKRRAESLIEQIEDKKKTRDAMAKAERDQPHLPNTQAAIGSVGALVAKLASAPDKERTALRVALIQQMRAAFFQVVFRPHAIVGLIELPEKPKSLKGAFGLPKPIDVRVIDGAQRYFLRHVFFRDDPEELAGLDGGKGIVRPRSYDRLSAGR
jgi:DNA invertase Pin-like site-specific DNA recombinase